MIKIVEDFQELTVNPVEAMALQVSKLIYICPDCDPQLGIAHLAVDRTWQDIHEFLATARA